MTHLTSQIADIVGRADARAAYNAVSNLPARQEETLPEALALFNTPTLDDTQKAKMLKRIFGRAVTPIAADMCAAIGRYAFSFPQWRFVAQPVNGVSLLEHFGMKKVKRANDLLDAALPDPQRDLYGTGYIYQSDTHYIEYRRAYIAISDYKNTIVIRNSSYFFGRDRLPATAYFSDVPTNVDALVRLDADTLECSGAFKRIQDITDKEATLKLLGALDQFDNKLSRWLLTEGRARTSAYLTAKLENPKGGLPYLGLVNPRMPQWHPQNVTALTAESLKAFSEKRIYGKPAEMQKFILLSGKDGDLPVKAPVQKLH